MKAKILIVDDDPDIGRLITAVIESFGHEATFLENAREALLKIVAESFDVVITDRFMPDMDGIEFTRSIRKTKPSLTIIGMSGDDNENIFINAGADSFIPKPLDFKILKNKINDHFKTLRSSNDHGIKV